MSKERQFPQGPLRELDLLRDPRYELNGNRLARYLVYRRAVQPYRIRDAVAQLSTLAQRDSHNVAVRPAAHLADELPPLLDVEYLPKGRHEGMVAPEISRPRI